MSKTRIAIPLYRSEPWVKSIAANVGRLAGHAAITISDATGDDDALEILREQLGATHDVEWIGPRDIAPGWVSHCNDLLNRSREEYFAWLPHDDEIGADWVVHAESVLDSLPHAVLALGTVIPVEEKNVTNGGKTIEPCELFSDTDAHARIRSAAEACAFGDSSLLGAAFRGVMRTSRAVPLPTDHDRDEWADVLWAVRMLVRGPFAPIPAKYGKRWHKANTHSTWSDARLLHDFRTQLLPSALSELSAPDRESIVTGTWSAEALTLRAEISRARAQSAKEVREEFEGSRSWRITKPLRFFTHGLGRLSHHGE